MHRVPTGDRHTRELTAPCLAVTEVSEQGWHKPLNVMGTVQAGDTHFGHQEVLLVSVSIHSPDPGAQGPPWKSDSGPPTSAAGRENEAQEDMERRSHRQATALSRGQARKDLSIAASRS